MPARVEFRPGSIFVEQCDLLVIPAFHGGRLLPLIETQVREARLPLPRSFPRSIAVGAVSLHPSKNPRVGAVAYAAVARRGGSSSAAVVEAIGRELGVLANANNFRRIVAPLLGAGTGAGKLPADAAAVALIRGFVTTAPASAVLIVKIMFPEFDHEAVLLAAGLISPPEQQPAAPKSLPKQSMASLAKGQRQQAKAADEAPSLAVPPPVETTTCPPAGRTHVRRKRVFVSYSHADAEWLQRLQKHLKPLQREGVEVWDDMRLRPGEPWREEIRKALAETRVAILLISADFLASDFIVTDELPPLLKAAEEDGATILPVIISPSRFERMESLSRFQAVNDPQKPLVQMRRANREKVLDDVARAVEDALKR